MWGATGNTSQDRFQLLILLVALICIPLMLLVKPLYLIGKMKRHEQLHNKHHQIRSNS